MKTHDGLKKFEDLVTSQYKYGGKKYASTEQRESTDELFDDHGKGWLFGTMDKYIKRFKNVARERDLLKIACYCYILWLKRGFFIKPSGLVHDVLDTTVVIKEREFPLYAKRLAERIDSWTKEGKLVLFENRNDEARLQFLSQLFKGWSKGEWATITEDAIFGAYYCCYLLWFLKYSHLEKHDEDVNNAEDRK